MTDQLIERALQALRKERHSLPPYEPPFEVFAVDALHHWVEVVERPFRSLDQVKENYYAALEIVRLVQGEPADRPARRMPSIRTIAEFHEMPDDECWRCGLREPLERAHIVDRCAGGLDGPQNLSLICYPCHMDMPTIEPHKWKLGMLYVGLPVGWYGPPDMMAEMDRRDAVRQCVERMKQVVVL
jgi:hypothetical protein